MNPKTYRVLSSDFVGDQLRAILSRAEADGHYAQTAAAARLIYAALTWIPHDFGESREYLPNALIHMRIGFQKPLHVIYGIHEPSRSVFVMRIAQSRRS